jgi:hypothetical protein
MAEHDALSKIDICLEKENFAKTFAIDVVIGNVTNEYEVSHGIDCLILRTKQYGFDAQFKKTNIKSRGSIDLVIGDLLASDMVYFGGTIILPHVLSLEVTEAANVDSRGVNEGLPYREFNGHVGRVITVSGWVENLSELDDLMALRDGELHALILPTSDSLSARLLTVNPNLSVENPQDIPYMLEFREGLIGDAP